MIKVATSKARSMLSELVSRVEFGSQIIGLTRRDKVVAVLVPLEVYERYEQLMQQHPITRRGPS